MKSLSLLLVGGVIGVSPLLTGCSVHEHSAAYPDHHVDVYAYQPGYYYDREYSDSAGHFHDRHYYYYDGHTWADRDAVPSGYTARERHEAHERHDVHQEHHDDD